MYVWLISRVNLNWISYIILTQNSQKIEICVELGHFKCENAYFIEISNFNFTYETWQKILASNEYRQYISLWQRKTHAGRKTGKEWFVQRMGTITQSHAPALVLVSKELYFFYGGTMIYYGTALYFHGKVSNFHGNTITWKTEKTHLYRQILSLYAKQDTISRNA